MKDNLGKITQRLESLIKPSGWWWVYSVSSFTLIVAGFGTEILYNCSRLSIASSNAAAALSTRSEVTVSPEASTLPSPFAAFMSFCTVCAVAKAASNAVLVVFVYL